MAWMRYKVGQKVMLRGFKDSPELVIVKLQGREAKVQRVDGVGDVSDWMSTGRLQPVPYIAGLPWGVICG